MLILFIYIYLRNTTLFFGLFKVQIKYKILFFKSILFCLMWLKKIFLNKNYHDYIQIFIYCILI